MLQDQISRDLVHVFDATLRCYHPALAANAVPPALMPALVPARSAGGRRQSGLPVDNGSRQATTKATDRGMVEDTQVTDTDSVTAPAGLQNPL